MTVLSFYCPSCAADKHTQELAELKSAVRPWSSVEVEQWKTTVNTLKPAVQPTEGAERMWSQVVEKKCKPKKPWEPSKVLRNALAVPVSNNSPELKTEHGSPHEQAPPPQREKVVGARRIWGTMKTTTVATVTSALSRLTSVGGKLQIRCTFKTTTSNHSRWWFVVRGSEEDLCNLDNEWDRINHQTPWELEVCYRLVENPPPPPPPTK